MIYVQMGGRLGNQMFSYAIARHLQESFYLGERLCFDYGYLAREGTPETGWVDGLVDFNVRPYGVHSKDGVMLHEGSFHQKAVATAYYLGLRRFDRFHMTQEFEYERKWSRRLNRAGVYWYRTGYVELSASNERDKLVSGRFEAPQYLEPIRDQLLHELEPKEPPREQNQALYEAAADAQSVCLSARRGDFESNAGFRALHSVCTREYFLAAVDEMKRRLDKPVFILFSDDVAWVKENIEIKGCDVYCEIGDDPVWEKLRLMMTFIDRPLKLAGKGDLKLDPEIPMGYVAHECVTYGLMLVCGYMRRLTGLHSQGRLFVGRRVKIRCAGKLTCGASVRIKEGAFIDALSTDGVRLGGGSLIGRNSRLECTGSLASVGRGIEIGERPTFGSDCYFGAAGGIKIGSDVMVGQYVRFHSENHLLGDKSRLIREQGVTHEGIVVGDSCWIGAGAVFLDGVELGEGCFVAANAVVTKSFPANFVVGGVPAKLTRTRWRKKMHVVVFDYGEVEALPPVVSVTAALLDLNIHTTLIASHLWNLPESISHNPLFEGIELGQRTSSQQRLTQMISVPRQVRAYLNKNINSIDAVWTATDISARSAGKVLLKTKHIMQLSELVEYVPAFANRKMPFRSHLTIELAKKASCVVVPEYNRAHIQKAWWELPEVPSVLPNKPYPNPPADFAEETASDMIAQEERKILLYQGVYEYDRDLEPYAAAIEKLGDSYALYLMGAGRAEATAKIRSLCDRYPRVHDVGFVPAPNHLAYTKYGHIGLLPYVLSKGKTRLSSLNPLFCAPNKIWEYSRYGLPMVGSDVPGLANVFSMNGIGETADTVEGIVAAVRAIEADYEGYSLRSSRYYNSFDFKSAVSEILERAGL